LPFLGISGSSRKSARSVPDRKRYLPRGSIFSAVLLLSVLGVVVVASSTSAAGPKIVRLVLDDEITPASAEVVDAAIASAESQKADALEIELNTPGGLDSSMRDIVSHIIASKVPVIVYVGPSGSRAASAGFVILLSSDLAAMAPGTVTGAAHPVGSGGEDFGKTMTEKITNDASAYVRTLAEKRGRDPAASESTIRESKSFTEQEALQTHLVELIARDQADLLSQVNGRNVTRFDGSTATLHTAGDHVVDYSPSMRQRFLMWLADPRIAFLLFALGALCVYAEFQHPGAIIPGTVGAVSVILGLYGFHMLPINLTGVLLIVVAIILFVLEAKVQAFGVLGLGGIVAAVIGSLILIDVPNPELRLPLWLVLAVVLPFALILMALLRLAFRARLAKVTTGTSGMIGSHGVAQTAIFPFGTVFVHGELWNAKSRMKIDQGEDVKVIGLEGLTLDVEPGSDHTYAPREASVVE
ncbi:MAG: NfeD family protein, partial [Blastocatellia bacterium]